VKTSLECLACYLRQTLQVSRIASSDEEKHLAALRRVADLLGHMDMGQTPPENSVAVYQAIAEITGCDDPYKTIKEQSNTDALAVLSECRRLVAESPDSLATALRLAIGGNIIDYGAMHSFDVDAAMKRCLDATLVVDHSAELLGKVRALPVRSKVLYLADNSGEIVYDSLVVQELSSVGLDVTVVVKSGAIINDALLYDARSCGMHSIATILENGTRCPGTPLASCSAELKEAFYAADLILSKGQGNFETLSEVDADIFFLLTIKCSVVGAHLAAISDVPAQDLPGRGELVLFHHTGERGRDNA
jgi:uncharacterized protein with ATP-grasp and redox domains